MQSAKWVSFGISNALTRTVVHFFPSEGGVTAPYPATCALRVFGHGVQEKRVVIEGARLSHPDGVRVEDAFPALKSDQAGIFGLEIEVATIQPRVEMSFSGCVIELASKGHSAKFWPKRAIVVPSTNAHLTPASATKVEDTTPQTPIVAPLIRDSFNTSSIVVVNGGTDAYRPQVCTLSPDAQPQEMPISSSLPSSAVETNLDEPFFESAKADECGWGLVRTRTLLLRDASSIVPRAAFLMYRDSLTRRPVSVVAL